MDQQYHGRAPKRPPTRRRALGDGSSRANELPQSQRLGDKHSRDHMPSSSPKSLPHNESIIPNGTLAVRPEQQPSPLNNRLSAVVAESRPHNSKRNSEISNASTNASIDTSTANRRRKTNIGPWQLGRTIGRGGCSRVRLVRHSGTGQYGAAKIISKATAEKVRALSLANLLQTPGQDSTLYPEGRVVIPFGLEREICIMKLLDHPNIVRLYDIWENRNELYLIMEYVEGGELFSYIHEQGRLIEVHVVHILRQIIAALLYCHRINIHHRDLKPENILLDRKTMGIKLVDFGMAALQPRGKKLTTPCGSPHYAAPEIIKTTAYDGAKADVWSCGVILYVLLTGRPPFDYSGEDRHLKDLFRDIQLAKYVLPDNLSPEASDLIRRILIPDPTRRIGLDDIWHHPFLRKYQQQLGFVGESTSQDVWTGPSPSITEWRTLERRTIDREILRYLRTLWHSEKEEVLIQHLLSKEANQEKYFYSALLNYHTDQLENYQPDVHHAVAKSNSDYHHNTRHPPTQKDIELIPSNQHKRSQSAYSILNNEHMYSKHSFYESPASEASYDPFRASRQPIMLEQGVINQNVTVHRGHSNSSGSRRPRAATSQTHHLTGSSLRVNTLRNNSKRSSAMSRGSSNRSSPSHRSLSIKQRSMSRSSLASSHWPSSPPITARSGRIGRRGVSFSHLRDRRSSVATASTIDYGAMAYGSDENTPVHRPHTSIGSYGSSDYSSSHRSSTRQPSSAMRVKSRATAHKELPRLRVRKPISPTKYIQSEARKVSSELGRVMEEAFNRSSVSSSVRTSTTGAYIEMSQYDTPPTSFSNTRNSGGSSLATPTANSALSQRPLPPIPDETPKTFVHRKLQETRAEIALRLEENGDHDNDYKEILLDLDRLLLPTANGRRVVSAPPRSPERHAPLHVIPEEKNDGGDGFAQPSGAHYRSVTNPVSPLAYRTVNEQQTIRLVEQSPTRVAPLNIRKRSGVSVNSKSGNEGSSVPWPGPTSTTSVRPYQEVQNELLAVRTAQATPVQEKKETVVKKKRSLWFRRNTEDKEFDQENKEIQVKNKTSTSLLKIPEAWQSLDDRIKNDPPKSNNANPTHATKQAGGSEDSEFPMRDSNAPTTKGESAPRKGFFAFFGKKGKEEKGRRPMELTANFSTSSSLLSGFDLSQEQSGNTAARTGPPEVQLNWLSRFLHIKPANITLCFHIGRGKVRQDLVNLLRDWQRFGIRDVTFDRETNIINARVDKNNHLKIKPVSFVIELFVVLEHGHRANLCLARFTQTRGAASSFRKVVDIIEDVCRARCILVEDIEKQAAMMEVLD
ncbi:serine/threonine-protein kinase-like protein GIN4 [Phaeosphaeriaceae sp. PMI808]|nr:serine/threonine-protein kinase-like protein GIN4 [Phaeosphaeriaceae sp. PMI808]